MNTMEKETDKRIFVIVLIGLLTVLFFLSGKTASRSDARIEQPPANMEQEAAIENDSLSITFDRMDGTLYVEGAGPLSADDLSALLTQNKLLISDIENIVIGDGITEIGYNTINGYGYLRSLKVGNGVEKIRNGAVKNCPKLRFVYLPSSVKKIAQDFLYGTTGSYLVSDGKIAELVEGSKISNASLIEGVSSYDELLAEYKIVPVQEYSSDELDSTDPEAGVNPMTLHREYIQFGPYCNLERGDYRIRLLGDDFDGMPEECVFINIIGYQGEARISNLVIEKELISYDASLSEDAAGVEFCLVNRSSRDVTIEMLQVFEKAADLPDAVRKWWPAQSDTEGLT